jgi:uncharacterized membrane protein
MTSGVKTFWKRLTGMFLAGVLVLLPVIITVGIVVWVVELLTEFLGPKTFLGGLLANLGLTLKPGTSTPYIFGWLVVLGAIFLLGAAVQTGFRKWFLHVSDAVFSRIPLLGSVYGTTKQVVELFDTKDGDAIKGMSPVFCFFGGGGELGLLAFLVSPQRVAIQGRDYNMVIVPTAPVPFGGALLFIPADRVVPAGMTVDAMMSIYLSMGVSGGEYLPTAAGAAAGRTAGPGASSPGS